MNRLSKSEKKPVSDQEFDHFFKSKLEFHEAIPAETNWYKIRQWSPFAVLFSFSKSRTIRVAAALIFLLLSVSAFFKLSTPDSYTASVSIAQPRPAGICQDAVSTEIKQKPNTDFVMNLQTEKEDSDIGKALIEKELEAYIAYLLEDTDEFVNVIDSAEMAECLKPVEQLPIDEMFAYIPELPLQEEFTILAPFETKITLPHRFIAHNENVEEYLLLYEINHNRK